MANRTTLLAAAAGLAITSTALADNRAWDSPVSGLYSVSTNWTPVGVPGSADRVTFDQSGQYTVTLPTSSNVTNSELVVRNDSVNLNLFGRVYTLTSSSASCFAVGGSVIGHGSSGDVGYLTLSNTGAGPATINTVSANIGGTVGNGGSGTVRAQSRINWNNSGWMWIGSAAQGTLYIEGAAVNTFASVIGANRPGLATVSGNTGSWIHSSSIDVGASANGTLVVSNGGLLRDTEAIIGGAAGITGSTSVSGANARWETDGLFVLGLNGSGHLSVAGGGYVAAGDAAIQCSLAEGAGSTGSLTIIGSPSRVTFTSGPTHFGRMGSATINITAGGRLDHTSAAYLASHPLGSCNVSIGGVGSRWIPGTSVYVGGTSAAPGGAATLGLADYGLLQIGAAGTLKIWNTGSLILAGGIIQTGNFSNSGTFNWISGTFELLSACAVGAAGPFGAAPVIGTGKILHAAGFSIDGNAATSLSIPGGTVISDYGFIVGNSNQGSVNVTTNGQLVSRGLTIGQFAPSIGTLTADGVGTHLNLGEFPDNQDMHVGKAGEGSLTISGGALATVAYNPFNIGNDPGSQGTVSVTGTNSQLSLAEYYISVGRFGEGTLEVLGGARLNATTMIAENPGSIGDVRIADNSIWTAKSITVGNAGAGSLTIESGANVSTGDLATCLYTEGTAQVTVTGPGSSLTAIPSTGAFGQIIVGGVAAASMLIDQSATAQCVESFIGDGTTASGTLTIRNNAGFIASEELAVGYNGRGTLTIESGADVSTQTLVIGVQGAAEGEATVSGPGSTLSAATMDIGPGHTGLLTIASGALAQASGPATIQSAGTVALAGGTLNAIAVTINGGTLRGHGIVAAEVANAGSVSPGNSAGVLTVQGNYAQSAAGALAIELGGAAPGAQHDQLAISGSAALGGTLNISLINGYQLRPGDSFTILTASSVTGAFSSVNLPPIAGGTLKVVYTPMSVVITYCYTNCDGSSTAPILTANDFVCFLNAYTAGAAYANCDGSTGSPMLTANDFQCFLNTYVTGCQ
jgi:T5SS/PEP-CTERM-associated repeat protein